MTTTGGDWPAMRGNWSGVISRRWGLPSPTTTTTTPVTADEEVAVARNCTAAVKALYSTYIYSIIYHKNSLHSPLKKYLGKTKTVHAQSSPSLQQREHQPQHSQATRGSTTSGLTANSPSCRSSGPHLRQLPSMPRKARTAQPSSLAKALSASATSKTPSKQ